MAGTYARIQASVAEEIFEAGRATINRGNLDLGLEFLLESVQLYENIHSVIHPEVAAAYNQYASTIHQLARLKISQVTDPDQPLGLDIGTALRLQRQAVIIAERTVGVWHAETLGYYFSLAMLENLEGNAGASLRYFRHVLEMWEVIHGLGHPEISTVLVSLAPSTNKCGVECGLVEQRRSRPPNPIRALPVPPPPPPRPIHRIQDLRPDPHPERPSPPPSHPSPLPLRRLPVRPIHLGGSVCNLHDATRGGSRADEGGGEECGVTQGSGGECEEAEGGEGEVP